MHQSCREGAVPAETSALAVLGKTLLTALPEEQPKRNTIQEGQDQGIPQAHTSLSASRSSSGSQRDASPSRPTDTGCVWGPAPALLPSWDVLLGLQRSAWAVGTRWLWLDVGSPSLGILPAPRCFHSHCVLGPGLRPSSDGRLL